METNAKPEARAILIRDARPDEAETIAAVIQESYRQFQADYPPESWARYYEMLGRVDGHFEKAEVIVAEQAGRLVGTVMFYADGSLSAQGEWPEGWAGMLRLAVLPEARGLGLGHRLTEECIRRARTAGARTLGLHTTEWMAVAKSMYERMGFVRDESFDFIPRSGIYAYGYRLDLS
jgi:predicted N-acetyltransferase YhbS